ncbi:MAG TPA: TonB-dependent receptor plug domain-containing protein, partial [Burkholderiales bacterium]|nr:TonB-dependent receptor plug domain-containing protein [Burkholderiales bacterium]
MKAGIRLRPAAAAIAALFGALPAAVLAQAEAPRDATLPEVNVRGSAGGEDYNPGVANVGRVQTPVRDIPQTVIVINKAVMEAQGATSLADVLRSVPGITIGAAEGGT